jgi:hypothetical protein
MFSGIDMSYDSAGVTHQFISDGMFTIDGDKNGQPIFIAKGKDIQVDLISNTPDGDFNFYIKENPNQNWQFLNASVDAVADIDNQSVAAAAEKPVSEPTKPAERKGTILDANPKNINEFEELNQNEILGWETQGATIQRDHKKKLGENPKCELERNENETYQLIFSHKKDSFSYEVKPYTKKEAAVENESRKSKLDQKIQIVENEQKVQATQQFIRTISISSFATYNWDIIASMKRPKPIIAEFNNPDPDQLFSVEEMKFTMVCLSKSYQVKFNSHGSNIPYFDAAQKNAVIAIAPDKKLYYVPASEIRKKKNDLGVLDLVNSGLEINNAAELDEFLLQLKKA